MHDYRQTVLNKSSNVNVKLQRPSIQNSPTFVVMMKYIYEFWFVNLPSDVSSLM